MIQVNISDAGEYKCVAKNKGGYAVRSVRVIVELIPPSSMAFRKQPRDLCVKEGHTAVFPCQVMFMPLPKYFLFVVDKHILRYEQKTIKKTVKNIGCFLQIIDHGTDVNVTWYKNGAKLRFEERRILKRKNRLVIKRATRTDVGTYMCVVSTATSDVQAKASLMMKGKRSHDGKNASQICLQPLSTMVQ